VQLIEQTSVLVTGGNKGLGFESARRLGEMVSSGIGSLTVATDPEQPVSKFHEFAYSSSKAALNMITIQYAKALPNIKFNVASPGELATRRFAATDMNNHTGELTVTEGTDSIVELATIDADGPTGTFIDRRGPIPW
jgi:NAD(P)-dependent dehydrogenase (short-subunit alcohol dehydrogenase family)